MLNWIVFVFFFFSTKMSILDCFSSNIQFIKCVFFLDFWHKCFIMFCCVLKIDMIVCINVLIVVIIVVVVFVVIVVVFMAFLCERFVRRHIHIHTFICIYICLYVRMFPAYLCYGCLVLFLCLLIFSFSTVKIHLMVKGNPAFEGTIYYFRSRCISFLVLC